ncbi:MAG: hypothetical protein V4683_15105 [Bacteroidota bacterium]
MKIYLKYFSIVFLNILTLVKVLAHPAIGIVKNSKGEIFFTDTQRIWKISSNGKSKLVVVSNVHTHELSIDKNDNIYGEHLWYGSSKWSHYIWKYSYDGKFSKHVTDSEGFRSDFSFNLDNFGNMYWLESGKKESTLLRKTTNDKIEILGTYPTTDVRWQFADSKGDFYFIDDNDLKKIYQNKLTTISKDLDGLVGENATRKPNNNTFGIWNDTLGNIYVAVTSMNKVLRIEKNGQKTIIYSSKNDWQPTGGLFDNKKNLWVLEANNKNQQRVIKVLKSKISVQ